MTGSTPLKRLSRPGSDVDVSSNVESEDAASSVSLPVSVISRRSKRSIVDRLVEKASKVAARKKSDILTEIPIAKPVKSSPALDKTKVKILPQLPKDKGEKTTISKKTEDSIKAVFGAEKTVSLKSQSKQLQEISNKTKNKSVPPKRKTEVLPVMQISLRKRNLVIPKPTNKRRVSKFDTDQNEGIVLRPRNVQLASSSRPGTRSAALVRRSKVF